MQISKINNSSNSAFHGYKITDAGLKALKAETNPEVKRALIDCCEYFKNKEFAHVRICEEDHIGVDLNLKIPDVGRWIRNFHSVYHGTHFNSKGIYITASYPGVGSDDYFVNLNGKPGDEIHGCSMPNGKMVKLYREFEASQTNIFDKIKAFKLLGDEVEKARRAMETSQQMNSEIDNLFAKQNY